MGENALNNIEPEKQFILKFKKLPVLWDVSNIFYTNKQKRVEAYKKLLPFLQKTKPDATTDDVRKKINSLRSNYRRELRKVYMSKKEDNVYAYSPKSWSFHYLTFLGPLEPDEEISNEPSCLRIEISDAETEELLIPKPEQSFSSVSISPTPESQPMKFMKRTQECSSKPYYSIDYVQNPATELHPIALEWASTLERLDPMQRLFAKKAINDILFEAELGNLTRYSVRINEPNDPISSTAPQHHSSSFIE